MFHQTCTSKRAEKTGRAYAAIGKSLTDLVAQMRQGKSDQLVRYLDFCAQFHQYSFGNIMLAISQRPEITRIAGLRQWNKLGRHVRPGEKGIMILAPMIVKQRSPTQSEQEDEPHVVTLFKVVYVFDISQTEGEPIPALIHASGDVGDVLLALEQAVNKAGITLQRADRVPGSPGAFGASLNGRIVMRADLDLPEAFRTLVHEFAHERLHWQGEKEEKTIRETEADATAFVVCRHFGVQCDTSDYLLLYAATPEVLLARLETIRDAADNIIKSVMECLPNQEERGGGMFGDQSPS